MQFKVVNIRKYKSKKYYNVDEKRYVNKQDLFKLFQNQRVQITCAVTGEDITNTEIPRVSNGMKVNVHDIKELFK